MESKKTPNIAFFDSKPYDINFFNEINNKHNFSIKFFKHHLTEDNIVLAKDFDAVCLFVNDKVNDNMISQLHSYGVKLIALRCAGFNNIDLKAAFGKIHVVRVPAYSPYAVAEHTVALLMALNRKTHKAYNRTRDANFSLSGLMGFDLHGKTAGIIGTGKIGKTLINILLGFGMNILAYDPFPDEDYANKTGIKFTALDTLFKQSDIISLHCPLTKETKHIINASNIKKMKPGVVILNTGRGELINSKDIIKGLKSEKIGAAGLDVYEEESDLFFEDHSDSVLSDDVLARLLTFNNVIVTSHQGFFTKEALTNIAETTLQNVSHFFQNNDGYLKNEVCYRCIKFPDKCDPSKKRKCF